MSTLLLGLEFEEALPEPVRRELEQLVAALQTFGGTVATSDAEFLVARASIGLTAERVAQDSPTVRFDFSSGDVFSAHVVGSAAAAAGVVFGSVAARSQDTRTGRTAPSGTVQITSIPASFVDAGTYTPTLTNVANLDASTAYACQWLRVKNTVTVSGKVDVDPTAPGAAQLGITLPIASNFANAEECGGVAFASGIAAQGAAIRADATNNRADMAWIAADLTNQPMYLHFSYQVI